MLAGILLLATPLGAQPLPAFPRFSVTAAQYRPRFDTSARIDPEGTLINFENDLGLPSSKNVNDFAIEWRPLQRHELAAEYVALSRDGIGTVNRRLVIRGRTYPVAAETTTTFDTSRWQATYTYWAVENPSGGVGLMLGAAGISIDARIVARSFIESLTVTEDSSTDVPVALVGGVARAAFTPRLVGEVSAAVLPHVKIDVYSGSAQTATAKLEWRLSHGSGVGIAYKYFKLDGTVTDPDFSGSLAMRDSGPSLFVRFGF